jgi:hypothetical protein
MKKRMCVSAEFTKKGAGGLQPVAGDGRKKTVKAFRT